VHLTRTLAAPPHRVWTALTDPAALVKWFWPESFGVNASVDPHTGGRYRIRSTEPNMAVSGEYREVTPPHRLVFTWQWDGEDDRSLVTLELRPLGGGTELVLRHEQLASDADRDNHAQGWSDCLDRLPGWLSATAPS
jgi:uncharacterized protein YndB with AHSA1/START domain